eukprot:CAMPEP_0114554592 /NCGR_PEP_ID=MMETSP0114-20121206/8293_1 /TAXON_ID=31324 /ORGANISM="Goniomonas sp, Strain m" /LENGTH=430 /DNA_ID=CAMNT_0001739651 /DNA_START=49 /DNA_END=1341 /DNA_ORIENTATION=+
MAGVFGRTGAVAARVVSSKAAARVAASKARSLSTEAFTPSLFTPTEQHAQLREMVRTFAEAEVDPQAREFNEKEEFNYPLFKKLGDLGLLGITVDPKYGGSGMDATAAVIAHEELAAADPAFCLSYLAHAMLFTHNLSVNGNEDQWSRLLPAACSGEALCGMAMTEPTVGTDVLAMKTSATKQSNGSYVLNGTKMWITNGAKTAKETGDCFLVYARTGGEGARALSLFAVDKHTPGFSLGTKITGKCGMRASNTAELVFEDVVVPKENLIGKDGDAVLCMMRNLEWERLTLAAMSTGLARRCLEVMNNYANERKSFGHNLSNHGQIQRHIAESFAELKAARCYIYDTASKLKLHSYGTRTDSDGVKLFAATVGKNIADRAIQVLGGNGYVAEYQVERLWRDAKLLEIGGGTNEAHHKNIAKDLARVKTIN